MNRKVFDGECRASLRTKVRTLGGMQCPENRGVSRAESETVIQSKTGLPKYSNQSNANLLHQSLCSQAVAINWGHYLVSVRESISKPILALSSDWTLAQSEASVTLGSNLPFSALQHLGRRSKLIHHERPKPDLHAEFESCSAASPKRSFIVCAAI